MFQGWNGAGFRVGFAVCSLRGVGHVQTAALATSGSEVQGDPSHENWDPEAVVSVDVSNSSPGRVA